MRSSSAGTVKFYRITADGPRVTRSAWTEGRSPRRTVAEFPDGYQAQREFEEIRQKKLREGFACVADAAGAARGAVVLDIQVPNRCSAAAFDMSPDGRTIVVGTMLKDAYGAEIHLIDVGSGHRELVHAEPPEARPEPLGRGQTFLHAALFDAGGKRVIYALNGETRLFDPASGQTDVLARYRQYEDAAHNPFLLRPAWDATRQRLMVFDAGDRVRILDAEWNEVFTTSTRRPSRQCWTGALSPSGKLMALCFTEEPRHARDRGTHDRAVAEVEIWDIDQRQVRTRIPMGRTPHTAGFDPADTLLVVNPEFVEGPCAFSLATGRLAWHFPDPVRTDRWATCYHWAYSPDGATLAIGRRGDTDVVDAATRRGDPAFRRRPGDRGTGRTNTVRISSDGTLVASGGDSGRIVVRKL